MDAYDGALAPLNAPLDFARMTVAEYFAQTQPAARRALKQLRTAIRRAAPGITEGISYRIPTFYLDGKYLLYIAAFREHVSVYPVTRPMAARYARQIARYRHGAGTLRFPLDAPIPVDLVRKLARVRVEERKARPPERAGQRTTKATAKRARKNGGERAARVR